MTSADSLRGVEQFEDMLKGKADRLVELLAEGNVSEAMDQITELYELRHRLFYEEVGRLTRSLHEAIKSFGIDVYHSLQAGETSVEFKDASHSLDYVVELTEKNAHNTMDRLDKALGLLETVEAQGVSEDVYQNLESIRSELTEILVAQSYQDISGQLIRKVIGLLTNVEQHLVELMGMASTVERLAGRPGPEQSDLQTEDAEQEKTVVAEGPQIRAKNNPDVACGQDDVDDLLSNLGF